MNYRMTIVVTAMLVPMAWTPGLAVAQQQPPPPPEPTTRTRIVDTGRKAGQIVTQPVRDVGITKRQIPPVLQEAVEHPYDLEGLRTCRQLADVLARLNQVLGADFDLTPTKRENRVGKLAEAGGGMVINAFIPFRGLVREISGAAPSERRYAAATDAGFARRGFLRGVFHERGCRYVYVPAK